MTIRKLSSLFTFVALLAVDPRPAHACTTNADCEDNDPCTINICDPVLGCQSPPAGGCMIGGRKLKLVTHEGDLRLRMGTEGWKGGGAFPEPYGPNDPVLHGGSLRIYSTNGDGFDNTYVLPPTHWRYIGVADSKHGYGYKDFVGSDGPVHRVILRNGRPGRAEGRGAELNFSLHTDPRPVNIELRFGGLLHCLSFGGATYFTPNLKVVGHRAPPPATCPLSPSGAFLDR